MIIVFDMLSSYILLPHRSSVTHFRPTFFNACGGRHFRSEYFA